MAQSLLLPFVYIIASAMSMSFIAQGIPINGVTNNTQRRNIDDLMGNPKYFGGDMVSGLGVPTREDPVAGFVETPGFYTYWTDGVVYWEFDTTQGSGFNENVFNEAIAEIESKTCVRFKKRPASTTSYVRVTGLSDGCNSNVGMNKLGSIRLNLDPGGCWTRGVIIHELLHAMGFNHEHQRYDRDTYITVNLDDVQTEFKFALDVIPEADTLKTGIQPYDIKSIMHYRWNAFGVPDSNGNAKQTIFYKADTSYKIPDPTEMSANDAAMVNAVYANLCTAAATTTVAPKKKSFNWILERFLG